MRKHLLLFPMFLAMILVVVGAMASVNAAAGDNGEPVTEAASAQDSTAPTVQHYTPGPNELPFVPNRP